MAQRVHRLLSLHGAYGRAVAPYTIEEGFRRARATVEGLPEGFRIHDLRHYYASMLIAAGLDVKVVQTRLRHASASTTLRVYAHLWPDADESARAAVAAAFRREPSGVSKSSARDA